MLIGLLLCIALGLFIYSRGVLDLKGTLLASLMGFLVYYFSGNLSWLLLLFVFLFVSFAATKYRFDLKKKLRVAESNSGRRSAVNVLANGFAFTFFAALFYFYKSNIFKAGYLAALASVTADTLSSEVGVLSRSRPVLITTLKRVEPGTDGGVTLLGELAGITGAFTIAISAWLLDVADLEFAIIACGIGGIAGANIDSLLGATLERRKIIGNASVNLISSLFGSIAGMLAISFAGFPVF